MSSYVIPVFPAASRVPPRDALAARLAELTGRFAELSSELAAIASAVDSVSGKADKAPPSAAGNLASLDASGNLSDSGATPASIKAAAVAAVVANAPGTMDTLEEIADILGSAQQSGSVLKRISDLESGKADSSSLAAVATSGSYDDLSGKPAIPAAVAIDATLAWQGAAADAKAVGDALRGGFTEWVLDNTSYHLVFTSGGWIPKDGNDVAWGAARGNADSTSLSWSVADGDADDISATRRLITPTKTSQLTNDGDGTNAFVKTNDTRLSDARTPTAHTHAIADVTGLNDALVQKANASDLPYALVTPGEWEFSGVSEENNPSLIFEDGSWQLHAEGLIWRSGNTSISAMSVDIDTGSMFGIVTATRASLPGHLLDRSGNRVVVSGDTTLTLPAANPGYLRDFLVRLEISGSTVPTITFAAPTGETITYETDGDEFPVPDEAGTWGYSFTENCVAHKFVVSLKKVNTVAQGGS